MTTGLMQSIQDPLLVQVKREMEAKIPPELQDGYQRILVAGMKLMYSKETAKYAADYLKQVKAANNDPAMIAHGIIKLLEIVRRESQGKMSVPAAYPAAIVLMCYALEDMEKMLGAKITPELIAQTTRAVTAGYFALFQITQEQIKQAIKTGTPKPGAAPAAPSAAPVPQGGM